MSSCTTTVPNSVRNSDPVGQTSRQAAWVQCLQTSEAISQRNSPAGPGVVGVIPASDGGVPEPSAARARTSSPDGSSPWNTPGSWMPRGLRCSMNATCRQVSAPRPMLLSIDMAVKVWATSGPPSEPRAGIAFHSLHATSQALHPMQMLVSVKNPIRGGASVQPLAATGSGRGWIVTSHLRAGLGGDARAALVVAQEVEPGGAPRPATGTDVA